MAIDPNIKKKADDIRNKVYGKEVRESLASGLEEMSSDVVENEGRQSVVESRQDSVESQWQVVSDEMTDKDVISAPEIIAARNGEANLKTRIDKDHQEVTAQLAHKASKKDLDSREVNILQFEEFKVLKGSRYDWTKVFEEAQKHSRNLFVPDGEYHANIEILNNSTTLRGNGKMRCMITAFDDTKPTLNGNRKIYLKIKGISFQTQYENDTASLYLVGSRYIYVEDSRIEQLPNVDGERSYTANGIDLSTDGGWTGYNTFKEVYCVYNKYGLFSGPGLNSVLSVQDSMFSYSGYFGLYLDGIEVGHLTNLDIADNGELLPVGTVDETKYGGTYIKGSHVNIENVWHEYNAHKMLGTYSPNNIYIHPDSKDVTFIGDRDSRALNGLKVFTEESFNFNSAILDTPLNDGTGKVRTNNLVKNRNFKHFEEQTNRPYGWSGYFGAEFTKETIDLPSGYTTGVMLTSIEASSGLYQTLIRGEDISNYIGRTITMSCWVKNVNHSTNARVGIDGETGNVYLSSYYSHRNFPEGEWTKVVISKKITGNEGRIAVGFLLTGVGSVSIFTGFSLSISTGVNDDENFITDSGGLVFDDIEVLDKNKGLILTDRSTYAKKYRLLVINGALSIEEV